MAKQSVNFSKFRHSITIQKRQINSQPDAFGTVIGGWTDYMVAEPSDKQMIMAGKSNTEEDVSQVLNGASMRYFYIRYSSVANQITSADRLIDRYDNNTIYSIEWLQADDLKRYITILAKKYDNQNLLDN